jgi:hypothetical protein
VPRGSDDRIRLTAVLPPAGPLHVPANKQFGILGQLYPIPWQKKAVDTAAFSWNVDSKTGLAHAKMDNGKGEVMLERVSGNNATHEVVIHNLKYWGAQSNDGFRMWKSKHEAFEGDGHKFSYDGTKRVSDHRSFFWRSKIRLCGLMPNSIE